MKSRAVNKTIALSFAVVLFFFLNAGAYAGASPAQEVAYRLKWLFNISVVGDLWADVNGLPAGG